MTDLLAQNDEDQDEDENEDESMIGFEFNATQNNGKTTVSRNVKSTAKVKGTATSTTSSVRGKAKGKAANRGEWIALDCKWMDGWMEFEMQRLDQTLVDIALFQICQWHLAR